ncbi:putative E3 ubiquitin-protein ligase RHA4A [Primulina tabacum]|uniref:putative E3 ubiquitin-protein ligase RHA4A n=1 Tax=Primulina tabacum TaxID=48773 RepID=UPI003F596EB1
MEAPQSAFSPPHQYPQAIQLKLYQAFIFSIPILFSIILFLLFYLFYLKRRASGFSSTSQVLPRTINDVNVTMSSDSDLKRELKNNLCTVLFDDYHKARDPLCCVCLGEFELKEELLQVPSCKHIFHIDCIRHWLQSSSTCPLCRTPVVSDTTRNTALQSHHQHHQLHDFSVNEMPENRVPNHQQMAVLSPRQIRLQDSIMIEGSSSASGSAC